MISDSLLDSAYYWSNDLSRIGLFWRPLRCVLLCDQRSCHSPSPLFLCGAQCSIIWTKKSTRICSFSLYVRTFFPLFSTSRLALACADELILIFDVS
jgi:hypothetical protein